jgi:hypothetical protein
MKASFILLGLAAASCNRAPLSGAETDLAGPGTFDSGALDLLASPAADSGAFARGVTCGSTSCDTTRGNVCCETFPPMCTAMPCPRGVQTTGCDGPEDCANGQVCCLLVAPIFGSACVADCQSTGDQRGRICHTRDDCPPNQQCVQLEVAGGLMGCFAQ